MGYSNLTNERIEPDALTDRVKSSGFGACVTFSGDVRDNDSGKSVLRLHYHAYENLARKELARIVAEAEKTWPETACAVVHRIGCLEIGESSVAIAVGAPHRAEAFEACRWIIDTIKTAVPIWKREEYADGETVWVEGSVQVPSV